MRPPIPYYGGKITTGPAIAALLPEHHHYVEPYGGSLAVLLAKPPSRHETVNDLDGDLMTWWRVLRDQPEDLARVCALTPHGRAEYAAAYEPASTDLERARRVWVQLSQSRAGQRTRTGWRHFVNPLGSSVGMPRYLAGYVDRIGPSAERLRDVSLECMPALDLIAKYGADERCLLYVDPPYLGSARQAGGGGYVYEMKAEADHRDLAAALHTCRAAVVLSGYASDLYDRELYAGWDRHTIAASTGQGGTWANRTEVLWSNRPLGVQPSLLDAFVTAEVADL
ncbi:DNA adenine methylase [Micromonospora sp. NPDC050187]|uniref:DNA adenine methylase n=1 Tax=Micromonospora sp. NPDC050187 TaxID=3364277 RepID=UPI00379A09C5